MITRLLIAVGLLSLCAQAQDAPPAEDPLKDLTPEQRVEHEAYLTEYAKWQEEVVKKQKEFETYIESKQEELGAPKPAETELEDLFFEEGHGIDILTDKNFDRFLFGHERALVFFYAPWCHHSKEAKDGYLAAAKVLREHDYGVLTAHNCQSDPMVCHNLMVTGLPTFKYFKKGKMVRDYVGPRTRDGFLSFMEFPDAPPPPPPPPPPPGPFHDGSHSVVILGDEDGAEHDFDKFMQGRDKVFVMFHAPWCPHSKETKPAFIETADELHKLPNEELGIAAAVDCHVNEALCGKFHIRGLPTFKYFTTSADGKTKDVIEYISLRTKPAFMEFLKNPVAIIPPPPQPPAFWRKDEL